MTSIADRFTVFTGVANYQTESVKVWAVALLPDFKNFREGVFPKNYGWDANSIGMSPMGQGEASGAFYGNAYNTAPEGSIVVVHARRTSRGRRMADAAAVFRLRNTAALVQLIAKLPEQSRPYTNGTCELAVFSGRADLLWESELRRMGDRGPNAGWFSQNLDGGEWQELFDFAELDPEISPIPEVEEITTASGQVVEVQSSRRVRRIRIRK